MISCSCAIPWSINVQRNSSNNVKKGGWRAKKAKVVEGKSERQRVLTAARYLEWISLSSIVAAYPGDIYIMLTPNEDPSLFNVTTLSPFLSLFLYQICRACLSRICLVDSRVLL